MSQQQPSAATPDPSSTDPRPTAGKAGLSRRSVLRAGTGGAAGAVVVGLGGAAVPGPGAAAAAATPTGPFTVVNEPHLFTERTRGLSHGEVARPAVDNGAIRIRILPINRAKFLAGGRFDLRVEAAGVDPATTRIEINVLGPQGPAGILTGTPQRTSSVAGSLEVTYPRISYPRQGRYRIQVKVTSGRATASAEVSHEVVVANSRGRKARNVIFFLGDGMGQAAITAARVLSQGITEGKYHGLLAMDRMEHRGHVGTSGADALATDSANSMSAYMTGHKASVNAMGVYEGNNPDPAQHPHVETMAELLKRAAGKAIGIVTTAEIQDATPAAVFAHTRRRSEYVAIMDQSLQPAQMPDVYLGGGLATLLPRSQPGSRRKDDRDLVAEFKATGFAHATTRAELKAALSGPTPQQLLGTFHLGNLNVYLDRQHIKKPEILGTWTDQPTLLEMASAALAVLEKKDEGFFLMIEGASIDKMEHPMDGTRAAYDAIEFDKTIAMARKWAEQRGDTLIVVTADHNHSMSIVGTHDRRHATGRAGNGVYGDATFPTYVDSNGDGFPDDPNPEVQLFFGWSNHPDHADDFQFDPAPLQPAVLDPAGRAVPNPKRDAGAELQQGNLPYTETNCVHCVDDVSIFATGPGAERFTGFLDNTEVFFGIMDALKVDARRGR